MRTIWIAAVAVATLAGCAKPWTPVTHIERHVLVTPNDPQLVRSAALRALQARRFQVEADEPGRLIALWSSRGITFRVEVAYDHLGYEIRYLGSAGLPIREEGSEAWVGGHYGRWVQSLNSTIQRQLEVHARQAHSGGAVHVPAQAQAHPAPTTSVVTVEAPVMEAAPNVTVLGCCINGAYYSCGSQPAFDQCVSLDPSRCSRVPGNDGSC